MKTVWKYQLSSTGVNYISMPKGAEILTVQACEGSSPALWALVKPDNPTEVRKILVEMTGAPIGQTNLHYIATIQSDLVYHIFEIKDSIVVGIAESLR